VKKVEKTYKTFLRTFEFHEVKKVEKMNKTFLRTFNLFGVKNFKKNEKVNPEDISSL
jgi:hypothetical protein